MNMQFITKHKRRTKRSNQAAGRTDFEIEGFWPLPTYLGRSSSQPQPPNEQSVVSNLGMQSMMHQTVVLSDIDDYLRCENDAEELELRNQRLSRFPHPVMLQVSYAELDFINRWCWLRFGPRCGDCTQRDSEYRVCEAGHPHSHDGVWTDHWFAKTEYNYGFNEWYFANRLDYDAFLENVPSFNWGEHYPNKKLPKNR